MRIIYILISVLFFSTSLVSAKITRQEYIDTYKDLAIKEMERTGIPASITLAQGILESGDGNSHLAVKANNHFGIKCHSSWKGKTIRKDDDKRNECFRKYKSAYDSYIDHSNFLTRGQRYSFLFDYKITNYKKWAKGLKKAGYATSKTYATRLIQIIEDYELYRFDYADYEPKAIADETPNISKKKKVLLNKEDYAVQLGRVINVNNRVKFIMAKKGDSYSKLTEEFQMLRFELYKYNDVYKGTGLKEGELVYLQPKRNKAQKGINFHIVEKGETLRSISQEYAVKTKRLIKLNNIKEGQKLQKGNRIKLR